MKYIVNIVQPDKNIDHVTSFQFDKPEKAFNFMNVVYDSAARYEPKTIMEMHPFDDIKALQEELLDGITDEMVDGFKKLMTKAEEEEDRESLSDSEHGLESETEVW